MARRNMASAAAERKEITSALCLEEKQNVWSPNKTSSLSRLSHVRTEHIGIGPCIFHWSQVAQLELEILAQLDYEIEVRVRLPLSLHALCTHDGSRTAMHKRSPSGYIESIARCVAAFQRATDACEHHQCDDIVCKIKSYAEALAFKSAAHRRSAIMELIREYIRNRTYDLALQFLLDGSLTAERNRFWSCMRDERQRNDCLSIIEICKHNLKDEGSAMRRELAKVRG